MDAIFRLLYFSEQFPKNTAMNHTMLTLCHHMDQVPRLPIDEIAALCNTNPMMLSRIARKLGYKNFSEFRLAAETTVSQSYYQNRNIPMNCVDPRDPGESFLQYMEQVIALMRSGTVQSQIDDVCSALHRAEKIHFYGPPWFSIYMVMLLHDLISDGKEIHPYPTQESILLDMDTITEQSLVFVVPNDLAVDVPFARKIAENAQHKGACLVFLTEAGNPLLDFTTGPNLTYADGHTAASALAAFFVLNMLTMTYRNRYIDQSP